MPAGWIYSNNPLAFIFPAGSRNFFTPVSSSAVASPPPPPECVWFVEDELIEPTCSTFTTTHGCQGDDQYCVFEKFADAVHSSDPGGGALKGTMILEPYTCNLDPNNPPPSQPYCSTCEEFTHSVFRSNAQCGIPGTCGQSSAWGCASGFEDTGGICQRSAAYQQGCAHGFDSSTCSCLPPPGPSCPNAIAQDPSGNCPSGYGPDPNGSAYCCPGGCNPSVLLQFWCANSGDIGCIRRPPINADVVSTSKSPQL